jgi:hypothetical protein
MLVSTTNENRDGSTITMIPQQILILNKSDDISQRADVALSSGTVCISGSEGTEILGNNLSHYVKVLGNKNEISDINGIKIYIDYDDSRIVFAKFDDSKFAFLNLAPPS